MLNIFILHTSYILNQWIQPEALYGPRELQRKICGMHYNCITSMRTG